MHSYKMEAQKLDFKNKIYEEDVYNILFNNYELLGKHWIAHQWNWINGVYQAFEDHIKYLIIVSLVEKTLNFYHQVNITKSYDEYYPLTIYKLKNSVLQNFVKNLIYLKRR